MKVSTIIILFVLSFFATWAASEDLIPQHKEWLDLVDPIMTKNERDVFLQLQSARERQKFIETFWKRRDPRPDTPENEFYQEYMQRVRFADTHFGHDTPKRGSLTERGRFYLILGAPLERQIFATHSDLYPLEFWHYKGETKYGLPPFFYLIFFQDRGLGEYRLYSPAGDGPGRLISPTASSRALNRTSAYQLIRNISGELASASLSYIPGDANLGVTPLSSTTMIADILDLAQKQFSDAYARQFLFYKDFVETEYSHNYTESQYALKIFQVAGQAFLHWTLEPSRINFGSIQGSPYANYQLVVRMEDAGGNRVLEKEEDIPLRISPEQYRDQAGRLFAFQDVLPIIPGRYTLYFLLKNKTGGEFTSFHVDVTCPSPSERVHLSNLLIYQSRSPLPDAQKGKIKAFAFGDRQYTLNTQNNCVPRGDIGVLCQAHNLESSANTTFRWRIVSADSGERAYQDQKPLLEIFDPEAAVIDTGMFNLSSLQPGYYRLEASLLAADDRVIHEQEEHLVLLAQPMPVTPWVFAKVHNAYPHSEHLFLVASQYYLTGDYQSAETQLSRIPDIESEPRAWLLLAQTYYAQKKYEESLSLALPLFQRTKSRDAARVIAADYAAQGDYESALIYLEAMLKEATEVGVVNLAVECYVRLDMPQKALPLIRKSLQIDPDQPEMKKLLKKLEEKRWE